jgi:phospholipid/cholesterol/gamma-HCH transport system substrate-binding protein
MKSPTKVGILFVITLLLVIGFALALGAIQPFSNSYELKIAYNFAGGIEIGSPVRVMGIKVGKVRSIEFTPDFKMPNTNQEVKLMITVSIDKKAWPTVRKDSQYFINLAGVIGEKFLEITPGSLAAEELKPGQIVRGEDPPRIDQLISQSYSLAGKVVDFVNKNEGSVMDTIETMNKLVVNLDKALRQLDKTTKDQEVHKLVKNITTLTDDMAFFSQKMRTPEGQKTLALLNELIRRLEPLDAEAIKKFLQKEGIRAHLF